MVSEAFANTDDFAWYNVKDRIFLSQDVELMVYKVNPTFFHVEMIMPQNHYVALSFGGTHINADMMVFVTHSNHDPAVYDMYSTNYGEPIYDDDEDVVNFSFDDLDEYPRVSVSVDRAFNTGDV